MRFKIFDTILYDYMFLNAFKRIISAAIFAPTRRILHKTEHKTPKARRKCYLYTKDINIYTLYIFYYRF